MSTPLPTLHLRALPRALQAFPPAKSIAFPASGSERQLHPAKRPWLSPSNGHHQSKARSPG